VSPDDVFVLVLVLACVGLVAITAVRSRLGEKSADTPADDSPPAEQPPSVAANMILTARTDRRRRRKR
jgi:hypothetical protein